MRGRRLLLFRGIALFMSAALAFVSAEIGIRVWQTRKKAAAQSTVTPDVHGCFPGYETPGRGYESQENFPPMVFDAVTCYRPKPGHVGHGLKINRQGFRYPVDLDEPTPADTFRVFILGGSFAFGAGCPDDATYFRIAETKLRAQFPDRRIEVICAAAGAFNSLQEHFTLITRVARYRPNLVVFISGANDAYFSTKGQNALDGNDYLAYDAAIRGCIDGQILPRYYHGQVFRDPRAPFPPLYDDYNCKVRWLIEKVAYNTTGRGQTIAAVTPTSPDETADRFLYVQQLNHSWGRLQNVPTVLLLQPTISTVTKPKHPAERTIHGAHTAEFHEHLHGVFTAIRQRLGAQNAIPFHDLNDVVSKLDESDCFFADWVHAGETGQRVLGEYLAGILTEMIEPGVTPTKSP